MSNRHDSLLDGGYWEEEKKSTYLRDAVRWSIEILRPAIFTRGPPRKQSRRTAYLDGLRGFAAFLVYWQHHQLWPRYKYKIMGADYIFENGFGYNDSYYFACLPVVRTFFTGGHFAVSVFFIISGYCLSIKPISLIHANEYTKLGDNLASALFRRWVRLFLPIIVVTFLYMTSWHLFGIWTVSPEHQPTYREELWNWYKEFKSFSFLFRTGGEGWFTYDFPTWSIPVEFKGSIAVYTALMAFSRCTKNARLLGQLGLIFYFMYIADGWYGATFIAGTLLCELDLLARSNELPHFLQRLDPYKKPIYYVLFAVSILLGGIPSHTSDIEVLRASPGWYHLSYLTPQACYDYKWFFLFWAAIFLVSSIPRIWWLKAFFECRFNQYLGHISFALYLVHGPIIWTLGDRLYVATGWYREAHEIYTPHWINRFQLSKGGPLGLEPSFLAPHIILLPFSFWIAEIVTKLVDEPTVNFGRWAYAKMLPPVELQTKQ